MGSRNPPTVPAEIGERHGHWTVIGHGDRPWFVLCRCDCGTERVQRLDRIRKGISASCGCSRFSPPLVRFWSYVKVAPSGCWLWTGGINKDGYAQFNAEGRGHIGSRWIYEQFHGPLPPDQTADHLCRARHCVNPTHLEAVASVENVRRGMKWDRSTQRSHCRKGHEYTEENTIIIETLGRKHRRCRTCEAEYRRRATERLREKRQQKKAA